MGIADAPWIINIELDFDLGMPESIVMTGLYVWIYYNQSIFLFKKIGNIDEVIFRMITSKPVKIEIYNEMKSHLYLDSADFLQRPNISCAYVFQI